MASPIPIRNLYHLLCYAWDVLPQGELVDIEINDESHPIDLLAEVLIKGTNHLLRRGIDQNYQVVANVTNTLRGRIDFATSKRRLLLNQGLALCEYDEISADILPNQILKATFNRLYRSAGLDRKLRKQCGILVRKLSLVSDIQYKPSLLSKVRLHRNNRYYRFLLSICDMVFVESIPDEKEGMNRFRDFFRDDGLMPKLYEKFIFNFYVKKQQEYKVTSDRLRWNAFSAEDPELSLLPSMLTDISLRSATKTIIIDAKFYKNTLTSRFDKERIHSGNLYQILAYLRNIEAHGGNDADAHGILLYPVVNQEVSKTYRIGNNEISIETLNLGAQWQEIEGRLLELAQ